MIPKTVENDIDYHLETALEHFEHALELSVKMASQDKLLSKEISKKMGSFTGEIFRSVREKGKANRMNLMKWFTLTKL